VLGGLVALKKQLYNEAASSFEAAIAAGNTDPLVFVNLGRARFGSKDYGAAIKALERAGKAGEAQPNAALLKSRAYWEVGKPGQALEVLGRGNRRFPANVEFARLEVLYLIKLGLFQELARRRATFLGRGDIAATDLAAIGEALRKSGRLDEAAQTLEAARLRFPESQELSVALARVLLDRGRTLSAAMLLERVARDEPKFLIEAAELYRRAGRLDRALFLNQQIVDQTVKIKQRLQILLEMERFEMIAAMDARLSRLGLLDDQQIRYALAYGFFMVRDFASAEKHIKQIDDPDLFTKGIELRKAMEDCKTSDWRCQ
jgi:tetratricopeptide (TPR) repeat protein